MIDGIRRTRGDYYVDGVRVTVADALLETGLERAPCPTCELPSGLTRLDGGDCLGCTGRKSVARIVGEGLWSLAIDNAGIGWRIASHRPPARVS